MPSIRTFFVAALLVPASLWGADFRQSNWGDGAEDVMAAETATLHHRRPEEIAFVDSSIEGIDGGVIYLFEKGRLVQGVHVSRQDYSGGEGVLADLERMRAHFSEVLGETGEESRRWIDESLRDQPERLAEAISRGHVRLAHRWTMERTYAELVLTGKDGGVLMRAVFRPTR